MFYAYDFDNLSISFLLNYKQWVFINAFFFFAIVTVFMDMVY